MRTRILRSVNAHLAEDREDHDVVPRAFAIEIAEQLPFFLESMTVQYMFGPLVVVEHVDAKLVQVHLVERKTAECSDGVTAESAIPRLRPAFKAGGTPAPHREHQCCSSRPACGSKASSSTSMAHSSTPTRRTSNAGSKRSPISGRASSGTSCAIKSEKAAIFSSPTCA